MITNDAGQVALKYYQPAQVISADTPSKKDYVFVVRASIAMAWVEAGDVANLLARKAGCNCGGGQKRQAYTYANETDVRRWTNGGGQ